MPRLLQFIPLKDETLKEIITDELNKSDVYIANLELVSKLQTIKLPIENTFIATHNILRFLRWVDVRMSIRKKMSMRQPSCIDIPSNELVKHFTMKKYKQYIDLLKSLKVMSIVPYDDGGFFKKKDRFNLYQFYTEYLNSDLCIVVFNKESHKFTTEIKLDKRYLNAIKKTTVDFKLAFEAELKNAKENNLSNDRLRIRLSRLFSLNGDRYIKKGTKVDRIYHSLTNLSKVSRSFQTVDGLKYNDIDIVNCQPLLLCYHLIKNKMTIDEDYLYTCQTGTFYETFNGFKGKLINKKLVNGKWKITSEYKEYDFNNSKDRELVKTELYKSVYFDFKPDNAINKEFGRLYPLTYQSLKEISKQENTIASTLQNIEAEIFNDIVPVKSKYYYTLFDAIYFTDLQDFSGLYTSIRNKFLQYGITPSIKINGGTDFDI